MEAVALAYLTAAWGRPGERAAIRAALVAANRSMPVIEVIIIATVTIYALYLHATGGKSRVASTVERDEQSRWAEKEETVFADPAPWLRPFIDGFRHAKS